MKTNGPCTRPTRNACRAAATAARPRSAQAVAADGWERSAAPRAARLCRAPSEGSAASSGDSASPSSRNDLPGHKAKCGAGGGRRAPPYEGSTQVTGRGRRCGMWRAPRSRVIRGGSTIAVRRYGAGCDVHPVQVRERAWKLRDMRGILGHERLHRPRVQAGRPAAIHAPVLQREQELAIERIAADGNRRVLDWGCGRGQMTQRLVDAGIAVEAFDYGGSDAPDGLVQLEHFPEV